MLSLRIFVAFFGASLGWSFSAYARPAVQEVDTLFKRQNDNQWFKDGNEFIRSSVQRKVINRKAKNVILFVGDGMGISTVTAARVLDGQLRSKTGEENVLSWEKFPHVALSKTYNTDAQTPDSAGTATAMMTGVKAREGVISVNEDVIRKNCTSSQGNEVLSILELAEKNGMASGVVSTARLTHATPSTAYAHSADRDWEYEADSGCADIAAQLLSFQFGDGIEVALGGGRRGFIPTSMSDPEYPDKKGMRKDSRDLTKEWTDKSSAGDKWEYVWKKDQFQKLNPKETSHVLGLFDYSHMQYASETAKDTGGEPSLSEMTEFAIKALQAKGKGFFLLVEGGRIDHGHHDNLGYRALHDAVEMAKAVGKADELTSEEDTLIIVTADHSHVFVFGGYQKRGNPIFALASNSGKAKDGKSFTSIGYYNGPSAMINAIRVEPVGYEKPEYAQQSLIPLKSETHGAEDVGIYARGPQAHLFQGVVEQNTIFHVMDYALCLTDTKKELCRQQGLSGQSRLALSPLVLTLALMLMWLQG